MLLCPYKKEKYINALTTVVDVKSPLPKAPRLIAPATKILPVVVVKPWKR
ncbi:hypothetical protein SAMN06265218_11639 [Fodinibius sediminis]|uniref:Uncharacterized protein n=1 Tax=Fodinibius sediminis TaxID=1214077 RepID=A0A521EGB2_9BACT|nr:hypothetical protein SAMN06265218_11639 [Fodinibius sediminis]